MTYEKLREWFEVHLPGEFLNLDREEFLGFMKDKINHYDDWMPESRELLDHEMSIAWAENRINAAKDDLDKANITEEQFDIEYNDMINIINREKDEIEKLHEIFETGSKGTERHEEEVEKKPGERREVEGGEELFRK